MRTFRMAVATMGLAAMMSGVAVAGAGAAGAALPKGEWRSHSSYTTYAKCMSAGKWQVKNNKLYAAYRCGKINVGRMKYMLDVYKVYANGKKGK